MLNDEKGRVNDSRHCDSHSPQSSDFVLVRGAALCLLIDSDEDIRRARFM